MRPCSYTYKNMHGGDQDHDVDLAASDDDDELGCPSSSSSDDDDDDSSNASTDDATSPPQPSPCSPLYGMSTLMAELPIKRGLSRHFQGKSQSFASLARARCVEDLAKPERAWRRRAMRPCRSYGGGLDVSGRAIAKRGGKGSPSLPSCLAGGGLARREERRPVHRRLAGAGAPAGLSNGTLLYMLQI